ncbi:DUF2796 domain-containing protein [Aliiglaciecola sp. 3_MG-2023]|uniref:ZrgA family zinc uptake protein n=1 Tax=Aliiglaciecola sp. 3_MG-2023 TaxID=3062644 RepID=UPI0026E236D3|nr:DUF2796 domain-containing protein [Aliiglaciecola sp. 3_MG-2023]MDO6694624.1 DUF2796 domain-containing protein [Aliiglaciecola sp. 3_MG-2023]
MKSFILGILIFVSWTAAVHSQQHIHGQGSVFIAQENDLWQVQFVLPASDILGFEHSPENEQQRLIAEQFDQKQKHFENLIQFDVNCTQVNYSQSSLEFGEDEHSDSHELSDNHEHSGEHEHSDIEILYLIECPDEVTQVSFPILNSSNNLQNLAVQWSIQTGQGSTLINPKRHQLKWH